jgi:hypothetical protein
MVSNAAPKRIFEALYFYHDLAVIQLHTSSHAIAGHSQIHRTSSIFDREK